MIVDAIARYHEMLSPELAAESWEQLGEAMRRTNLVFGERPICNVLRPYFLSPAEAEFIYGAARLALSVLERALERIPAGDYESVLGLSPREAALARIECGFRPVETLARLDGFLTRDGHFGLVEYNAESPGGIAFGRTLADIFLELPVMKKFAAEYRLSSEPVLEHSLDALVGAYRAWGGKEPAPSIAIVDWKGAPTKTEFEICREMFEKRGFPTRVVDPEELTLEGGRLRAGDFEIDLVYRRLVASEAAAKLAPDHPLVRAAELHVACVASGFGAFALTSKALFAIVSDPASSAWLASDERVALDRVLPWTRIVRDGQSTDWNGQAVDVLDFALREREQLVVKPATEYGGSGVVLGWTVDDAAWAAALRDAAGRPSVIQRRVPLPTEPFPVVRDGSCELVEFMADIDPYRFNGLTGLGAGTRLSQSQLLNVTAGGGSAAPVFIIERR